jgi:hypothetical protein
MFAASKTAAVSGGPPDDKFNYVTMLLHGDGTNGAQNNTFVDSSSNNFSITRNGNTTQGSFSPYGSNWSNYFVRASTQYLTVSNAGGQFSFGTGAFTIECWVNLASMPSGTGYPTSYWLFGGGPVDSDAGIDFYINNTQIGFNLTTFSSPTIIGNHGMSVGVWYHVAVVRGGGSNQTLSIYVNGTRVATASSVTATADAATTGIAISAAEPSGATSGNFNGYISNHRIVKGTAVYDPTSSTLTVPTAPLTAITNTQLLTCQSNRFIDNSTNAFAITVNGTPSVQRFNPFGTSTAYSTSVIGGSGYFDGSGDYLSTSGGTATAMGTGDFTWELWVYVFGISGYQTFIESRSTPSSGSSDGFYFGLSTGSLNPAAFTTSPVLTSSIVVTPNAWNHVALTRQSGTLTIWVNGASAGSVSNSTNLTNQSISVGGNGSVSLPLNGYASNVRMIKGTAVYTATFTPPTAPVTAVSGTSLLANMTNGAIFDNAMMNDLETVGNAQISTTVKKYGTGSLAFDGTGDYLTGKSNPIYAIGTANFTVEAWVYPTAFSAYRAVFDTRTTLSNGGMDLGLASSSAGVWGLYKGSAVTVVQSSTNLTLNTWQHIAAVRSGSTVTLYLDGVSVGSATDAQDFTEQGCHVGRTFDNYTWSGYIDDLRVTRGYARYTTTFTPPTAAFPNTGPI